MTRSGWGVSVRQTRAWPEVGGMLVSDKARVWPKVGGEWLDPSLSFFFFALDLSLKVMLCSQP